MPYQQPHNLQQPKRKDRSTTLKRSLSFITPSLARFRNRRSSSSKIRNRSPVITVALQKRYAPGQNRAATGSGVSIKIGEDSPALEISIRSVAETKPKTKHTSRCSSRTKATSFLPNLTNLETDMHLPRSSLPTISSPSSDMSSDKKLESRSIHFPAKLPDFQRMNMQDNFIKSLISKLTNERREKRLVLRGSKRHRYLATVKKVMDSGWVVHSQVLDKFKRGRKRKLDEQST